MGFEKGIDLVDSATDEGGWTRLIAAHIGFNFFDRVRRGVGGDFKPGGVVVVIAVGVKFFEVLFLCVLSLIPGAAKCMAGEECVTSSGTSVRQKMG